MSPLKPLNLFSNAVRAKEIVTTLARYGFEDLLHQVGVPTRWLARIVPETRKGLNTWQRTRAACEDLGPTFVKLGQILSTRVDVLPKPLLTELKMLRKEVRPVPFDVISAVLEEELGGSVHEFFDEFDENPVACGSLGQVYKAILTGEKDPVAVKIQRPGIKKDVLSDLEIAGWLAKQAHQRVEILKAFDLPSLAEEARRSLLRELDFRSEARNASLFNDLNPYAESVFAPKVHDSLSTEKLLITEWVDGKSPDDSELSQEEGKRIALNGGLSVFHQILLTGFFHADPHGGNVAITADGRLCLLDWGLAGHLTRKMRYNLADLLMAVVDHDPEKIVRVALGIAPAAALVQTGRLERDTSFLLGKYGRFTDGGQDMGKLMMELIYLFGSNGVPISRDYNLLAKAILAIEETGKSLDPDFNIGLAAKPILQQLAEERWNPLTLFKQAGWFFLTGLSKIQELPDSAARLLRRIESENLSINLLHKGLPEFEEAISSGVNRLTLAIIIGALIIGSSLIVTTGVAPYLWGYPVLGLAGYLISALLGFWIVLDILRHGKHR